MWICGRKKTLIRDIWGKRHPPGDKDDSQEEEESAGACLTTLGSLQKQTLVELKKRLLKPEHHACLHLQTKDKGGKDTLQTEKEISRLIGRLKKPSSESCKRTKGLKATCRSSQKRPAAICLNPEHWNYILQHDPPSFLSHHVDSKEESSLQKYGHQGDNLFSLTTAGSALVYHLYVSQGGDPPSWCKLAYWEESHRVGPQFPVFEPSVDVFSEVLKGSGLSLSSIFTQNKNPSTSTRETRRKIGRGLSLSQEFNGLWIHNKSSSPIFVNSPTLDLQPLTGKFIILKVPPGHSLLAFDYETSHEVLSSNAHPRDVIPSLPTQDERVVRVSFAKGWGEGYKRPNVMNCPCWLEIRLGRVTLPFSDSTT